jgi:hypothetical protein
VSEYVDFHALFGVLLAGLIGGVGLVALFAVGIRAVDWSVSGKGVVGYAVAATCFLLVAAGIVVGVVALLTAAE